MIGKRGIELVPVLRFPEFEGDWEILTILDRDLVGIDQAIKGFCDELGIDAPL